MIALGIILLVIFTLILSQSRSIFILALCTFLNGFISYQMVLTHEEVLDKAKHFENAYTELLTEVVKKKDQK